MALDMQAADIAAGVARREARRTWREVIALSVVEEPTEYSLWIELTVHTLAAVEAGMVQRTPFSIEVARFAE